MSEKQDRTNDSHGTDDPNGTINGLYKFGSFELKPVKSIRAKIGNRVRGIGINDAPYEVTLGYNKHTCPAYKAWLSILNKYRDDNLSICPDWQFFMRFRKWLSLQPWRGAVVDCYLSEVSEFDISKESCVMVPRCYHSFLLMVKGWEVEPLRRMKHDGLPIGVSKYLKLGNFQAKARAFDADENLHLGYFDTVEEARDAYDTHVAEKLTFIQGKVVDENPKLARILEDMIYCF